MKTPFDPVDTMISIINVAAVTGTIDGNIYRNRKPVGDKKRNVAVLNLTMDGGADEIIQSGTLIINCFAEDLDHGMIDEIHLKATVEAIITRIEAYNAGSTYFHPEVQNINTFASEDENDMSYMSIRVNYWIEK